MTAALAVVPAPDPKEEEEAPKFASEEFDADFQTKIVALALRDSVFNTRTMGLIDPGYFETDVDAAIVKTALDYFETYKKAPDRASLGMVLAEAVRARKIRKDLVADVKARVLELIKTDISDRDFVVKKVADFARNKAVERAIIASVELLERKDYSAIKKLMDQASLVGASDGMDAISFWSEKSIEERFERRIAIMTGTLKREGITTGIPDLDKELYHRGWGRKELSAILGAAKAGKSMALADFAKNASLAGYNVIYVSLEVSKEIIAERCEANVADIAMKVIGDKPHEVKKALLALHAKAGEFVVKDFPSGSMTVPDLRRLIEYYRATGVMFDLIVVDYADIMRPESRRNETRDELNEIYIGLRALSFEYNAAVLTATQTNREGAKSAVAKATDVAEDFNKVRTVDVMLSINANADERATGEGRIYFAVSRNSEDGFTLRIKQNRAHMQFIKSVIGRE